MTIYSVREAPSADSPNRNSRRTETSTQVKKNDQASGEPEPHIIRDIHIYLNIYHYL